MARWQSLHEGLHAATQALAELAWELHVATQVPAQLVGLAAACERWWKLGRRGPGGGPASILGEGLAGWPGKDLAVARCRPRQGSCRGSCGFSLARILVRIVALQSLSDLEYSLSSQRSACHHGALAQRG